MNGAGPLVPIKHPFRVQLYIDDRGSAASADPLHRLVESDMRDMGDAAQHQRSQDGGSERQAEETTVRPSRHSPS